MKKLSSFLLVILFFNIELIAMDQNDLITIYLMELLEILKDHLKEIPNAKWSYKIFNEERKKIKIEIPNDHVIPRVEGFRRS